MSKVGGNISGSWKALFIYVKVDTDEMIINSEPKQEGPASSLARRESSTCQRGGQLPRIFCGSRMSPLRCF